jgi:Peptidase family S41
MLSQDAGASARYFFTKSSVFSFPRFDKMRSEGKNHKFRWIISDVDDEPFRPGSLDSNTPFARFTTCDLSNPGAFHWRNPVSLTPQKPYYMGKIVILVDESSISQAEYTSMAFRAAHGAIVVGSRTAGADGNVSPFALSGGLPTMISGIGVFYPDKSHPARRHRPKCRGETYNYSNPGRQGRSPGRGVAPDSGPASAFHDH